MLVHAQAPDDMEAFDRRENGYKRVEVPSKSVPRNRVPLNELCAAVAPAASPAVVLVFPSPVAPAVVSGLGSGCFALWLTCWRPSAHWRPIGVLLRGPTASKLLTSSRTPVAVSSGNMQASEQV